MQENTCTLCMWLTITPVILLRRLESKMAEWHTTLERLETPDGAVAGLSASDKAELAETLLQLPAADGPSFFVGQPKEVQKTVHTLPPDAPSGQV